MMKKIKSSMTAIFMFFCFSLLDGNFTAYESPLMLGTNVRELKLREDRIGQRTYDVVVAAAPRGQSSPSITIFPKPGTKQTAIKQPLRCAIGSPACGVSYFK